MTDDICNIWKDRQDPKIFPTDSYPVYVRELLSPQYTGDDIILQLYRGERLPTGKEQWRLAKSYKRQYMMDGNRLIKRDWQFESDDDEGEDLGSDVIDEDYEDELEEGEQRQLTEEELLIQQAEGLR